MYYIKDYVIYSDDYLELYDVENNQFKCITHHTFYVRDIWFASSYIVLLGSAMTGFIIYFTKKKFIKNK